MFNRADRENHKKSARIGAVKVLTGRDIAGIVSSDGRCVGVAINCPNATLSTDLSNRRTSI